MQKPDTTEWGLGEMGCELEEQSIYTGIPRPPTGDTPYLHPPTPPSPAHPILSHNFKPTWAYSFMLLVEQWASAMLYLQPSSVLYFSVPPQIEIKALCFFTERFFRIPNQHLLMTLSQQLSFTKKTVILTLFLHILIHRNSFLFIPQLHLNTTEQNRETGSSF